MRLAVLIDADNAKADAISDLLAEVSKFGVATVKRAYGDWTTTNLQGWKKQLHKYAIQPMQQFSYTRGKNSTDASMIIDGMDLLYTGNFDGFCIVSSDCDFTRLATRFREAGLSVYGFGEKKTPEPFVAACDRFIFTEILGKGETQEKPAATGKADESAASKELLKLLRKAVAAVSGEDGWASLSNLGSHISKIRPSFDSRNYGYSKLSTLVKNLDIFETRMVPSANKLHTDVFLRLKDGK